MMTRSLFMLLVFLTACILKTHGAGCSKSIVSFNVGLLPRVPEYDARAVVIPDAIKSTSADVICLQEFWYEHDMEMVLSAVKDVYPHSYSPIHYAADQLREPQGWWGWLTGFFTNFQTTACGASESMSIFMCYMSKCRQAPASTLAVCLLDNCPETVAATSQTCIACLTISMNSVSDMARCGAFWKSYNRFNNQGLMILSKHELKTPQTRIFFPDSLQLLPRGFLEADVDTVGKLVCTHLSSNLGVYLEPVLTYGNYEAQQAAEIRILNQTFFGKRHLLVGDLNTGPGDPSRQLDAEFGGNFALLEQMGYRSPYNDQGGLCTYCKDNPLVTHNRSHLIDHVMSRSFSSSTSKRILETYQGTTLSDHYGVEVNGCF